ncbi:hypothetical protein EB796_003776 [Bugula neritina]|uniref:Uncharacterized protein n=1 Tax=Bugula neritina TaxID=10212 RepID=A0A7J7KI77_BUGNE|nr:hypothetical protein EB796_003776 [Bugula neritina]
MESDSDDEALCFNSNLLSNQGEATAKINESEVLDSQDLFAAETQAMSYGAADGGSEDDMLFDCRRKQFPTLNSVLPLNSPPQVEKSSAEKDENDGEDLFDFETQAAEFNQSGEGDKEERNSNADSTDSELSLEDVFCMPTTGRKRSSVETNCSVDDGGETQVLDKSEEKTPPKKKSRPTLLLHRASPLLHSPVVAHAACNGHASQNQLGHASQNQLGHASQNQLSQQTIVDDSLDEANSPEFIGSPEIDVMQTQAVVTVPESDEEHDMTKVIDSSIDMFSKETQVVPVFHHTSDVADDMADVSQSDELFCMQTQAVCYTSSQVNPENELLEAETQPVINASGESSILNDSLKENINQCIDKLTREEVSPQKELLSCSQHLGLSSVNSGITPPTPDTAELSVHSVTAPETKHPVLSSRSENELSQSKKIRESPTLKESKVSTPSQKSPGAKFTPTGVTSASVGESENSVKEAGDNSSTADISSNTRLDSKTPYQSSLAEVDSESSNNGRRTQSSRLKIDTASSSRPDRHKQRPVRFRENSKKKNEKGQERGKSDSSARNRGSSDHTRQVTEGVESPEETLISSHRRARLAEREQTVKFHQFWSCLLIFPELPIMHCQCWSCSQ